MGLFSCLSAIGVWLSNAHFSDNMGTDEPESSKTRAEFSLLL